MLESKVVKDVELADAATVAKDGYEAMFAGEDMVVSGSKNKVQVALVNIIPDRMQSAQMEKIQEPATKK